MFNCPVLTQPTTNSQLKTLTSHKNLTKITILRKGIPYRIRIHTHTGTPAMRRRCQRRRRHSVAERRRPDRMLSSPMLCAVLCTRFAPVLHWLLRARPIRSRTRARAGHGATTSCLAWPRLTFLAGLRAPPQFELGQLLRRRLFRHDWSSRSTPTIRQIAVTWRRQCHDNRREVGTGVVKTARL